MKKLIMLFLTTTVIASSAFANQVENSAIKLFNNSSEIISYEESLPLGAYSTSTEVIEVRVGFKKRGSYKRDLMVIKKYEFHKFSTKSTKVGLVTHNHIVADHTIPHQIYDLVQNLRLIDLYEEN